VFNPSTYPNFLCFLNLVDIPYLPTEMTFSVSRAGGEFEWSGRNLFTFFCQPRNLLKPGMWVMLYDILRFNACARRLLDGKPSINLEHLTIGAYLKQHGYSNFFINNYLIPMVAAVWSTPPEMCFENFPVYTLIKFLNNHHLLQLTGKPSWLTIKGGSQRYVRYIASRIPASHIHLSTSVKSVLTREEGSGVRVEIMTESGSVNHYDHVIMACHSDEALKILRRGNVTPMEEQILSKFRWNQNEVILHYDSRFMPRTRSAWSCWNYISPPDHRTATATLKTPVCNEFSLTYCMNQLQHISEEIFGPVLVTLNPLPKPKAETIIGKYNYQHPIIDQCSVEAQSEIVQIQNIRGISYTGAYLGYGFHEDGFRSGLQAAVTLGANLPFSIKITEKDHGKLILGTIFDILSKLWIILHFLSSPITYRAIHTKTK